MTRLLDSQRITTRHVCLEVTHFAVAERQFPLASGVSPRKFPRHESSPSVTSFDVNRSPRNVAPRRGSSFRTETLTAPPRRSPKVPSAPRAATLKRCQRRWFDGIIALKSSVIKENLLHPLRCIHAPIALQIVLRFRVRHIGIIAP